MVIADRNFRENGVNRSKSPQPIAPIGMNANHPRWPSASFKRLYLRQDKLPGGHVSEGTLFCPFGSRLLTFNTVTIRNEGALLEVLAGAIRWGFKSPSPHQITGCFINEIEQPFFVCAQIVPRTAPSDDQSSDVRRKAEVGCLPEC